MLLLAQLCSHKITDNSLLFFISTCIFFNIYFYSLLLAHLFCFQSLHFSPPFLQLFLAFYFTCNFYNFYISLNHANTMLHPHLFSKLHMQQCHNMLLELYFLFRFGSIIFFLVQQQHVYVYILAFVYVWHAIACLQRGTVSWGGNGVLVSFSFILFLLLLFFCCCGLQ